MGNEHSAGADEALPRRTAADRRSRYEVGESVDQAGAGAASMSSYRKKGANTSANQSYVNLKYPIIAAYQLDHSIRMSDGPFLPSQYRTFRPFIVLLGLMLSC